MSQKKRGLGRGLGALIPSGPETDRPVDVFFPASEKSGSGKTSATAVADRPDDGSEDRENGDGQPRTKARTATWDSAIAGGRLSIRTGADGSRLDPTDLEPAETAAPTGGLTSVDAILDSSVGADVNEDDGASTRSGNRGTDSPFGVITRITVSETDGSAAATDVPEAPSEPESGSGQDDEPTTEVDAGADDSVSRETELVPVPGAHFAEVLVDSIRPNTWQPRTVFDDGELDELVASISEIGVLQPIVVRPDKDRPDGYELIMGERRWRAAQAAGLDAIPAIVRSTEDSDMLRDALLENLHRAALNPLEEAAAYRQLLDDFGCTHEELAGRIARSRPQISNTLRLLKLPPLVQRRVAAGVLSAGHARALLGLSDGAEIERLAQRIVSEGLSVRATEEVVTLLTSGDAEKAARRVPRAGQRSEAMDELASRLSDRFETRVKVNLGKSKGRLTVEFASVDDLNRILEVIAPEDPGLLRR